jgi:hypothetical protein
MWSAIRRLILLMVLILAALAATTVPALAKGPGIMMVYGAPLTKPVVVSNWRDNAAIMFAASDSSSIMHARLTDRPSLRVAMFWGLHWMRYMQHHKPLAAVHPAQAVQFARFYPAHGGAPALFVFDSIPGPYTSLIRRIGASGLEVLARYGVPVRLPARR